MEEKEERASRAIWVTVTKGFTEAEDLEQDWACNGVGRRMDVGYTSSALLITVSTDASLVENRLRSMPTRG